MSCHELGWPEWTFACVAVGVVIGVVFVAVQRRTAVRGGDPLLRLDVLRVPGFGSGLSALACMQVTYGGFLFAFTLHLQTGLGRSALATGLTYVPMATVFGLVGYSWRRIPARTYPILPALGLVGCVLAYLGFALAPTGGALMWVALVVDGVGMGLAVSPLLALSLLEVPVAQAGDASGLLTTTMQLSQVLGVAVFGTVFLSLRGATAAISATSYGLAVLALAGVVPAVVLARTVLGRTVPARTVSSVVR
jgi:Major Facilitator Superfamily